MVEAEADDIELICSAKRCRAAAVYELRWNNPGLHVPGRRKTWLACAGHHDSLAAFLSARGFLREVLPLDLTEPSGADAAGSAAGTHGTDPRDTVGGTAPAADGPDASTP